MHRHHVPLFGPAVGILEHRGRHPEIARALRHVAGKAGLGAVGAERLGDHRAGVVARQHHDPAQQVLDPHPVRGVEKHGRAAIAHRVLRDRQPLVEAEPAVAHRLEGDVERHELGHRGRRQGLVAVLVQKDRARRHVEHIRAPRAGLERAGLRGQHDRGQRRQKGAKDCHCGAPRCCFTRRWPDATHSRPATPAAQGAPERVTPAPRPVPRPGSRRHAGAACAARDPRSLAVQRSMKSRPDAKPDPSRIARLPLSLRLAPEGWQSGRLHRS